MPEVDRIGIELLNQAARRWPELDAAMLLFTTNDLIKGGALVAVLYWVLWNRDPDNESVARRRLVVLGGIACSVVAVLCARLIASIAPFRIRPVLNPELGFIPPLGVDAAPLERLSAFPSDHATLYVGLAMTVAFVSPRAGAAAMLYVLLVDGVARVYVGAHHPTDILAGALLGVVAAVLAVTLAPRIAVLRRLLSWSNSHPQLAQPLLFIVLFQIATVFDDTRGIARFVLETGRVIVPST